MNTIILDVCDPQYYDDAVVLVRSFFPRTEVMRPGEARDTSAPLLSEKSLPEGPVIRHLPASDTLFVRPQIPDSTSGENGSLPDKKERHETFKRELYRNLSQFTGRTLPWGYLTGVRPSKIAFAMLQEGAGEKAILEEFEKKHLCRDDKARLALTVARREREILGTRDFKDGYSLYIGIPFCPTTCLYCSFPSYPVAGHKDQVEPYIDALIREMRASADIMRGKRLDTVYFGGGTPTALSSGQLDRLLTALEEIFPVGEALELTVEAGRPDSVTPQKMETLRRHNVTRVSVNPQTMNDDTLALIGRRHSADQVREAFHMARVAGFDNINMDMILGLPGEDEPEVKKTLEEIEALGPESLTVHSLAIKRAAALNVQRILYRDLSLVNSDALVSLTHEAAARMGLSPYYMYRQKNMTGNFENVGFAKVGKECLYNILIMEEVQTIVACGAGAATKRVFPNGRIERAMNVKDIDSYIRRTDEMADRKRKLFSLSV
ncbi:MAG: coproporphyrinogen dehydrogenase HemZ [Lachnospira sp.]|nr:coproporphyrinogen dehydrogenase HemZ [Lachnospira sp.]